MLKVISSSPGELEPVFETMLANADAALRGQVRRHVAAGGRRLSRAAAMHGDLPSRLPRAMAQRHRIIRSGPEAPCSRRWRTKQPVHVADLRPTVLSRRRSAVAAVEARRHPHTFSRADAQG